MKIGNKELGQNKVFVIAEVGSNHEGCIKKAKEHIDIAADIGADAVKFQSLNSKKLYINPTENIRKLHALIDMEEEWHIELSNHSKRKGIIFSSSPTYLEAVAILERVNVDFVKIASAQIGTYPRLIEEVAKLGKPTLFSTGIATYNDITNAVRIFRQEENDQFAILHCNSQYPTPAKNVYLKQMQIYKSMFNCIVGFSDHTDGIEIVMAAVALGAQIIEKHFKINDDCNSPDARISIDSKKFSDLVKGIKKVEQACQAQPRIFLEQSETKFRESIKYKLVLKKDKSVGQEFKKEDFLHLRTKNGIEVTYENLIIENMTAKKEMGVKHILEWGDVIGCNK